MFPFIGWRIVATDGVRCSAAKDVVYGTENPIGDLLKSISLTVPLPLHNSTVVLLLLRKDMDCEIIVS